MSGFVGGVVARVLAAPDPGDFRTAPVETLVLDLEGIAGDRHRGFTRPAGPREPWYRRGTPIRSGRQLSLVSTEELAEVARRLGLPAVEPGWIGANIVVSGIPDFTRLPWGTRIFCAGGAVLVNEGENAPCRIAGAGIAAEFPGRRGLDRLFVEAAKGRRGLVASVERAGAVASGPLRLKIPKLQKQWTRESFL